MDILQVIIDPGHGPTQAGKRSPHLPDGSQFFEWKSNWAVGDALIEKLNMDDRFIAQFSLKVTRSKIGQMLKQRVEGINAMAQGWKPRRTICLSIHSNAFGNTWSPPSGIETYYFRREKLDENYRLASIMNDALVRGVGFRNRGIKPGNQFAIIKQTNCITLLTEVGFYTNQTELAAMMQPSFPECSAEAHYQGLVEIHNHLYL
jgi:N-acetylmuramoyl-L-alanine amidase